MKNSARLLLLSMLLLLAGAAPAWAQASTPKQPTDPRVQSIIDRANARIRRGMSTKAVDELVRQEFNALGAEVTVEEPAMTKPEPWDVYGMARWQEWRQKAQNAAQQQSEGNPDTIPAVPQSQGRDGNQTNERGVHAEGRGNGASTYSGGPQGSGIGVLQPVEARDAYRAHVARDVDFRPRERRRASHYAGAVEGAFDVVRGGSGGTDSLQSSAATGNDSDRRRMGITGTT